LRTAASKPAVAARASALDIVEGLQLGHAVAALHELGILAALQRPATAKAAARAAGVDGEMLEGILDYVSARTDLLDKRADRFTVTSRYSSEAKFLVDMYASAYGKNAAHLTALLRRPRLAAGCVDRSALAAAFDRADGAEPGPIAGMIRQLGLYPLLDLGCGTATMLRHLAASDDAFVGWGVERDASMLAAARASIRRAGLTGRVRVFEGDAGNLRRTVPADVVARVRAISATQVVNEMFRGGGARAVAWLRSLRRLFPKRVLVVGDYYGRLGSGVRGARRETLLHDFAQLISGQGVPPHSRDQWSTLYRKAGCRLAHVVEDRHSTLFVHFVVL
jgi:SAM-dependent methyltransferase